MDQHKSFIAWCHELGVAYQLNKPLSGQVWLGIGGPADIVLFPDVAHFPELISHLHSSGIPYYVLGKGSNVLVTDTGFRGAVICTERMNAFSVDPGLCMIHAEAGALLQQIIRHAADHGFCGMEGLAGIPGTIAGAVAGNAGSFGAEMKDVVQQVDIVLPDGMVHHCPSSELHFHYRHAAIPQGGVITAVTLRFDKADPEELRMRVHRFRSDKRARQPVAERSAGCVFKNPPGDAAGRLIDVAGCKGMQQGGIAVSQLHANFFINTGGGTARDYCLLMEQVQERVFAESGVRLEPEIRIVGEC